MGSKNPIGVQERFTEDDKLTRMCIESPSFFKRMVNINYPVVVVGSICDTYQVRVTDKESGCISTDGRDHIYNGGIVCKAIACDSTGMAHGDVEKFLGRDIDSHRRNSAGPVILTT